MAALILPCAAGEGDHAKRGGGGSPGAVASTVSPSEPPSPGFAWSPPLRRGRFKSTPAYAVALPLSGDDHRTGATNGRVAVNAVV